MPITKGVDDAVYDAASRRIYTAADGNVDVYEETDPNNYKLLAKVPTAPLGRTAKLVPELNRYFLAVPRYAQRQAEVRVYEPIP